MLNVCKLLSDQFTAEKAANGALTEPLREVFADRATGKLDQCSAGDGQDKGGEEILKSPFWCLTALCFQSTTCHCLTRISAVNMNSNSNKFCTAIQSFCSIFYSCTVIL